MATVTLETANRAHAEVMADFEPINKERLELIALDAAITARLAMGEVLPDEEVAAFKRRVKKYQEVGTRWLSKMSLALELLKTAHMQDAEQIINEAREAAGLAKVKIDEILSAGPTQPGTKVSVGFFPAQKEIALQIHRTKKRVKFYKKMISR